MDKDDDGYLYIVVHSGSRNLGKEVALSYQNLAVDTMKNNSDRKNEVIKFLKDENRESEIQEALKNLGDSCERPKKGLEYLEGVLFDDYIEDMCILKNYAYYNRMAIIKEIYNFLLKERAIESLEYTFETVHNYIDVDDMILRKGAVSAKKGKRLIIPMNMRDGSLICIGKGNEMWNYSAPHGAGRLFSRKKAKDNFKLGDYENEMKGIYSTSVNENTLDESPMAYKSMEEIIRNIGDTVDIKQVITPIYNFKAH